MDFIDRQATTSKRKKPRHPPEVLEVPRRYAVKNKDGSVYELRADSKEEAMRVGYALEAHLMGTHENLKHATQRLWR